MSLQHALLGFLNYMPLTGYELKKYFDKSVNHFWHAELSQIYPTLARMKEEGLLEAKVKYQENAPNSKVYSITEAGREELRRWMNEPSELGQHREAFLIKVFFGSALDRNALEAQLLDQMRRHQERLALYQSILDEKPDGECPDRKDPRLERERIFWRFTMRAGILNEDAWIAWCEETIGALRGIRNNEIEER